MLACVCSSGMILSDKHLLCRQPMGWQLSMAGRWLSARAASRRASCRRSAALQGRTPARALSLTMSCAMQAADDLAIEHGRALAVCTCSKQESELQAQCSFAGTDASKAAVHCDQGYSLQWARQGPGEVTQGGR